MTRALGGALVIVAVAAIGAGAHPRPAGSTPLRVVSTVRGDLSAPLHVSRVAATPWCGTASEEDRAPNRVAGNPVHWVYAIPSDGEDRLATVANVMQDDADQVDAWWRSQDSTRTLREDLTTFSCGDQLDITTLRLTQSAEQLSSLDARFALISDDLERAGLSSSFVKYLVYYDGAVSDPNVCGQGGGDPTGVGVAAVYYQACVGVSTAAVAAHEVLHTLGAVDRGAPHDCPGANEGHVCDTRSDIMYPAVGTDPLSAKLLDPGRDDYYGHSGSWVDTQDSAWLVRLDAQTAFTLTVSGPGSVAADVPGLQCSASCTTTWNTGTRLALTATPGAGAKLVRWGGACTGTTGCTVGVAPGTAVSALFAPASFRLSVGVTGRGVIRSARSGIACRPKCSAIFASYTPLALTATPAVGWKLRSWSGACKGSKRVCTVPMSAATAARATFVRR